jgi:hypothetical protein
MNNPETKSACPVCLDTLKSKIKKLPCGHKYHTSCIRGWSKKYNSCPVCRAPIDSKKPIVKLSSDDPEASRNLALQLEGETFQPYSARNCTTARCDSCYNTFCTNHGPVFSCVLCGRMNYCSVECSEFGTHTHGCELIIFE